MKILTVALIILTGLFILSAPSVLAQGEPCTADLDCDGIVDALDVAIFLTMFGRNQFNDPCPDCYDSPCPCTICPYGMVDCDDKCVDPMTDRDYCGVNEECLGGTVCAAGEICSAGVCGLNCPPGLTNCAGTCVDPMTDRDYCGVDEECLGGTVCDAGEICSAGVCSLNCPPGLTNCAGTCVDPMTDRDYCGVDEECLGGTVCDAGEICSAGVCSLNCPPGLTNCAGTCVDTDTDEGYCGSCTNSCASGEFCVAGSCDLVSSGGYPAPVEKTGQTTSYATGDDGDLERGVAWPNPRFTNNGDGTVTDNLTGLIWLQDANCFGLKNWDNTLSACNGLANGQCGLTDGSNAGDWKLPNRKY
jgi:hypothetical protein